MKLARLASRVWPFFGLVILSFLTLPASNSFASKKENTIHYTVRFPKASSNRVDIELRLAIDGSTTLTMPAWTPGSYLIREYARNIESISAVAAGGDAGEPVTIKKLSKDSWQIQTKTNAANENGSNTTVDVVVQYRIYCRESSVRTNWVESDYAFLTGAATFLMVEGRESDAYEIEFELPAEMKTISTALRQVDDSGHVFVAQDFDDLVDSPILIGNISEVSFDVGGKKHSLATVGDEGFWDYQAAAEDIAKIVAKEHEFWSTADENAIPYENYAFLNIASGGGGGLEHDNSTVLMASRYAMRSRDSYVRWLGLVAHEFFHTWNVRRLRPRVLMEYDYNREQHFPELFIAEGITSYFDSLIVAKSDLSDDEEYLADLSRTVKSVMTSPGRLNQSLHDSSFDAWTKLYRPNENSVNANISYYSKGALVAALLDVKLQTASNGEVNLRDVMVQLWNRHLAAGYTLAEFESLCSEMCEQDLTGWFETHVHKADEIDFAPLLDHYGLRWKSGDSDSESNGSESNGSESNGSESNDSKDSDKQESDRQTPVGGSTDSEGTDVEPTVEENEPDQSPKPSKLWAEKNKYGDVYTGWRLNESGDNAVVRTILRGGPAESAGLNVGDEIVAINGTRVLADSIGRYLGICQVGDVLKLTIARHTKIRELSLTLEREPEQSWQLQFDDTATAEQIARRTQWLGSDW